MLSDRPNDTLELDQNVGVITLNKVSEGRLLSVVSLEDADGNSVSTDTLIGRPLVVNFWFSTCEPCRREFPVLVDVAAKRPDVRFVGVNLRDTNERAEAFMRDFGATFENYFDRDGRLTSAMGVATAPVTLVVDQGGVVRQQLTGEITESMLVEALERVFPT